MVPDKIVWIERRGPKVPVIIEIVVAEGGPCQGNDSHGHDEQLLTPDVNRQAMNPRSAIEIDQEQHERLNTKAGGGEARHNERHEDRPEQDRQLRQTCLPDFSYRPQAGHHEDAQNQRYQSGEGRDDIDLGVCRRLVVEVGAKEEDEAEEHQ